MKKGLAAKNTGEPLRLRLPQGSPADPDTRAGGEDSHEALIGHARGGIRTRTLSRAATFKVAASTSWATRARIGSYGPRSSLVAEFPMRP